MIEAGVRVTGRRADRGLQARPRQTQRDADHDDVARSSLEPLADLLRVALQGVKMSRASQRRNRVTVRPDNTPPHRFPSHTYCHSAQGLATRR